MITPALAALILAAAPTAPAASDHEALLRLRAGDAACTLLTSVERSFLDVVLDQARDDAIVAGADEALLDRYERAARAPACDDAALRASADAHRARLSELAELTQPILPGRRHAWAVRPPAMAGRPGWRVAQMLAITPPPSACMKRAACAPRPWPCAPVLWTPAPSW